MEILEGKPKVDLDSVNVQIINEPPKMFLGLRVSAIAEILLFHIFMIVLSHFIDSGERFIDFHPHPFWIILLLIIIQYGVNESIFCVFIMVGSLYICNKPEPLITESLYEYWERLSFLPFLWTTAAIVLGKLRTKKENVIEKLHIDLREKELQSEAIADAYRKLQKINEAQERRLASEVTSALKIYEAAKTLEALELDKSIAGINDIVISVLNPEKFSFYLLDKDKLELQSNTAWGSDDKFVRLFDPSHNIFKAIIQGKKILSILNDDDISVLGEEGVLAGPIIDPKTSQVYGMLKIEALPFKQLTLRTVHMFKILCEWVGMAVGNIEKIKSMEDNSFLDHNDMIYSYNFFKLQQDFLRALAQRMKFHLTKLNIKIVKIENVPVELREELAKRFGEIIRTTLRKVDLVFDAKNELQEFIVLLPGTPIENVKLVIKKIEEALLADPFMTPAKFSFTIMDMMNDNFKANREQ